MSTRLTTESGSQYPISDGYLYRQSAEGDTNLGDKIQVSTAPFAVGESAIFILVNEEGDVYRVQTTPVVEVDNV